MIALFYSDPILPVLQSGITKVEDVFGYVRNLLETFGVWGTFTFGIQAMMIFGLFFFALSIFNGRK